MLSASDGPLLRDRCQPEPARGAQPLHGAGAHEGGRVGRGRPTGSGGAPRVRSGEGGTPRCSLPPPSTPTCIVPQRSRAQGLGSAQPLGDALVGLQHCEEDLCKEKIPGLLLRLGRCFWVTHGEGRVRGGPQAPAPPGTERP